MINDVDALTAPGALEAVATANCVVCLMHKKGEPATMQRDPTPLKSHRVEISLHRAARHKMLTSPLERQRRLNTETCRLRLCADHIVIEPGATGKNDDRNAGPLLRQPRYYL